MVNNNNDTPQPLWDLTIYEAPYLDPKSIHYLTLTTTFYVVLLSPLFSRWGNWGPPLQAGCFSQRPPSPLGAPPSAAERRFGARALVTFAFPRRCHSTLALKRFWMSPCFLYQEVNRHTDPGWPHDNTDPTKHPWNYVLMWFSPLSSASWYHLLLILNPLFSCFPLPRTCLEHA